ncbi:acetyl esterase/lipase [Mycobacterium sp. MAA66]|uniref:alpha/beta hydrolase n=1 Tax=Mycobacterium sp. MAA66 TaxID=3156297 RepID=UPI003517BACE
MTKLLTGVAGVSGAAALAVAALLGRRYLSMRDAIATVPPEFRSPLLVLSVETNARSLKFNRFTNGAIPTPCGPGVSSTVHEAGDPSVPVLLITPDGMRRRPGVLYIHGGGMVLGSAKAEAIASGRVARELNAVVASPDYRLAPEYPYPAAIDDCMAALRWMHDNADELGIDPARLAVTGSSAGGGLSASVAQRAYDEGITLCAQVMVAPMLDDRSALLDHSPRGRLLWTTASNRFGWTSYLGQEPRPDDNRPYIAAARREDLTGLAPAWIGVGELDLFHDESVDYAQRLQAAGVPCELVTVPGMYHGAEGLVPHATAMREFLNAGTDFLRKYL